MGSVKDTLFHFSKNRGNYACYAYACKWNISIEVMWMSVNLLLTAMYEKALLGADFFRPRFKNAITTTTNPGEGGKFYSLWKFVTTLGGGTYMVAMTVAIFAVFIGFLVSLSRFFMATGRSRDEAKAALKRDIIISFLLGALLGIIQAIITAFSWS